MFSPKKIALGTSAAALALGLSLGATGMASATTTPAPAPAATSSAAAEAAAGDQATTGHNRKGHGLRGGVDAAGLAAKLSLDETAVTGALQEARDAAKAGTGAGTGEKPDRDAFQTAIVASLAQALGLGEAAVQTAIDELEAEQKAERSAAVQDRLDAAVTDGSLTQAEADGAAKALKLGILGGGGRG